MGCLTPALSVFTLGMLNSLSTYAEAQEPRRNCTAVLDTSMLCNNPFESWNYRSTLVEVLHLCVMIYI